MKYTNDQSILLHLGITRFEVKVATLQKVFLGELAMVPKETPAFTGVRVEQYDHLLYFAICIGQVENFFGVTK